MLYSISKQMEKVIIDIIDKKAAKQYAKLTPTKRKAYRAMLYAGAQITLNGCTVRDIAVEIGYSEGGTSKLVQKWIELMQKGDVTVNLIIAAIHKLPSKNRFQHEKSYKHKTVSTHADETTMEEQKSSVQASRKSRNKNVLGFIITPEDEMRERAAIRASILFFQTYGKGRQPRMDGEYYEPEALPKTDEKRKKWLPLDTAAIYCGCNEETISRAGQNGIIERRIYKRNTSRNYYEYNIADLDKFIAK